MKQVGLFDAKTRFSEICDEVARLGQSVVVTRRGQPLVRIEPLAPPKKKEDVWDRRKKFEEEFGPLTEDFELPKRQVGPIKNFLDD
jgi:prevent-host-death family protein